MTKLTGIIQNLPEEDYHSRTELSSTGARQLLESPARFRYNQDHLQPHKAAFDLGTAVHSKVLGVGSDVMVLDFDSYRTKDAQTARDEAYAAGLVPMLAKDMHGVDDMTEAVLAHPSARLLFEQPGSAEASVFATDPGTGVDVRARFDYLPDFTAENPICVDLKTTGKTADADSFMKTVSNFGYHIQQAHYLHAYATATGDWSARMKFVVVETGPPYLVAVHELAHEFAEIGDAQAKRARELFAQCTATNEWPGYPTDTDPIQPPMWMIYQDMDI